MVGKVLTITDISYLEQTGSVVSCEWVKPAGGGRKPYPNNQKAMAAMPATAKLSGSPLNPMVVVYGLNLNMLSRGRIGQGVGRWSRREDSV